MKDTLSFKLHTDEAATDLLHILLEKIQEGVLVGVIELILETDRQFNVSVYLFSDQLQKHAVKAIGIRPHP